MAGFEVTRMAGFALTLEGTVPTKSLTHRHLPKPSRDPSLQVTKESRRIEADSIRHNQLILEG